MSVSDKIDPLSDPALAAVRVCRISDSGLTVQSDVLAVEEPLEVRLGCDVGGRRIHRAVSITMRTPGHDLELAVGFLFTEGVIVAREQIAGVRACGAGNVARVDLHAGVAVDLSRLERHFYTSSSCGVCGKASLEAVRVCSRSRLPEGRPVVEAAVIHRLPEALRAAQAVFDRTGGLHAAALFDAGGNLLCLREDVGRHNALDKLIGAQFLAGRTPLSEGVLLVSGRASFELVQKAVVAGIPILAAVGAPSSLAVSLAREHGLTVLGFVRQDRFNIYTGAERIRQAGAAWASVPEILVPLICGLPQVTEGMTMFSLPLRSHPQPSREPFSRAFAGEVVGGNANDLTSLVADPNVSMHDCKAFSCQVRPGRLGGPPLSPTVPPRPGRCATRSRTRRLPPSPREDLHVASREQELAGLHQTSDPSRGPLSTFLGRLVDPFRRGAPPQPQPPTGFYTDTTVCIGCKACEVACKQWNQLPADGFHWSGNSYDNTGELSATSWRHVKFVEQFPPLVSVEW